MQYYGVEMKVLNLKLSVNSLLKILENKFAKYPTK